MVDSEALRNPLRNIQFPVMQNINIINTSDKIKTTFYYSYISFLKLFKWTELQNRDGIV